MWIIEIDYVLLLLVMITRTVIGTTDYMNEYKVWRKVNNFLLFCILLGLLLNLVHS